PGSGRERQVAGTPAGGRAATLRNVSCRVINLQRRGTVITSEVDRHEGTNRRVASDHQVGNILFIKSRSAGSQSGLAKGTNLGRDRSAGARRKTRWRFRFRMETRGKAAAPGRRREAGEVHERLGHELKIRRVRCYLERSWAADRGARAVVHHHGVVSN